MPKDCIIEFQKAARIAVLEDNYALFAHPFPQLDGEMLLIQQQEQTEGKEDVLMVKDVSLRKRLIIDNRPEKKTAEQKRKDLAKDT